MHPRLQTDYYDKMKQNAAALPVATVIRKPSQRKINKDEYKDASVRTFYRQLVTYGIM